MYERPMIYDNRVILSGDEIAASEGASLPVAYNHALHEVIEAANAAGDYLDPNSVRVQVIVSARAL